MENPKWYELSDIENVISPSLLVYLDRIEHNIRSMIAMAGGTENLRPHIKTHKTAEIIKMQLEAGIRKFKCATIAEAELLGICDAPDILLAMQPVGANMERFFRLIEKFRNLKFSALVDNRTTLNQFSQRAKMNEISANLWLDINNGMNRTGIAPNEIAAAMYRDMNADPNINAMGLHVYDGHLRNPVYQKRKNNCDSDFNKVLDLKRKLSEMGVGVKNIVAGGSPTFPFHAKREGVEASPGTTLLWDFGYGSLFPEMDFLPAAVLITRIISKPSKNTICLDLGHKSIASEMPFPRMEFLDLKGTEQIGQSEEHLVLKCENWEAYDVGDICYAIPKHICPTVAKYESMPVVKKGRIIDCWQVVARNQKITV